MSRYPTASPLSPEEIARLQTVITKHQWRGACTFLGITMPTLHRARNGLNLAPDVRDRIIARMELEGVEADVATQAFQVARVSVDAWLTGMRVPADRAERIRAAVLRPLPHRTEA